MNGLTSKYDSRLHQVATLMMLAAYLFFAFGEITIEAMHRGIHAWQNATHAHQSHTHHHALHGHEHSHHHHDMLGFLKRLVDASNQENSPENITTVEVDKHLLNELYIDSPKTHQAFTKHVFFFFTVLMPKHSWHFVPPPNILMS